RIDEGGVMRKRVLASAGVSVPGSPLTTVLSLLAYKARLQYAGLKFQERPAGNVAPAEASRIDAMHIAAQGLASVDIVLATLMQTRQLAEALRAGDRA